MAYSGDGHGGASERFAIMRVFDIPDTRVHHAHASDDCALRQLAGRPHEVVEFVLPLMYDCVKPEASGPMEG